MDTRNHYLENRINGRKIKMPIFYGEDPEGWFYRAELYFSMNEYFEEEKLRIIGLYFEGRAFKWFKWYNDNEPFQNWDEFKMATIEKYIITQVELLCRELMDLKQIGTVVEYYEQFEMIVAAVNDIFENTLENIFLRGLRDDIQAKIMLFNPKGLNAIMRMAKQIELKNRRLLELCTSHGPQGVKNRGLLWEYQLEELGYGDTTIKMGR